MAGFERLLEKVDRGERPLHRPREWQAVARRKNKLLSKAAWYRPADLVVFIPATPGGELVAKMKPVLEEEGKRLGLTIKSVESGGTSLKRRLTGRDLSAGEPCGQPGCRLSEDGGCSHSKAGILYRGSCDLCEQTNISAEYFGESGFSGFYRTQLHVKAIEKRDLENAFAKHLYIFHPEHQGNPANFTIKVIQSFRTSLTRKVAESVYIYKSSADILMNSKSEFLQPAVPRVVAQRELPAGPELVGEGGGVRWKQGAGGRGEQGGGQ